MPRASRQALRRLVAHNASPEQSGSSNRQRDSTRRESRPRDRSSGGSSRHSNASEEERIPAWAQTLLDAQKESDQRLKSLEHEIKETGKRASKKRERSPAPEFKYKRNKIQFDINKSVMEKIETALEISDDEERSATLNEGKDILVQCNKHIKLAEKYGWETVDCYVEEPLASDSDDDKKIRHAIKESKAMKEEKRKSSRTVVKPQSVQSRLGSPASSQRNLNDVNFRQNLSKRPGGPSSSDATCFRCGRRGHIARVCRSPVANNEPGRTVTN